jgi:hypothetical protein
VLEAIFGSVEYAPLEGVVSRRIDPLVAGAEWQEPLCPHIDALFHALGFSEFLDPATAMRHRHTEPGRGLRPIRRRVEFRRIRSRRLLGG